MATQNPIEYEGTYPFPEAQLDRFLFKLKMGYPTQREEIEVLSRAEKAVPIDSLETVITLDDLIELQHAVKEVNVDDTIKSYIVELHIGNSKESICVSRCKSAWITCTDESMSGICDA